MNEQEILIQSWIEATDFDKLGMAEQLLVTESIGAETYTRMRQLHLSLTDMEMQFPEVEDRKHVVFGNHSAGREVYRKRSVSWYAVAAAMVPLICAAWWFGRNSINPQTRTITKLVHDTIRIVEKQQKPRIDTAIRPAERTPSKAEYVKISTARATTFKQDPVPRDLPGMHVTSISEYKMVSQNGKTDVPKPDQWTNNFEYVRFR